MTRRVAPRWAGKFFLAAGLLDRTESRILAHSDAVGLTLGSFGLCFLGSSRFRSCKIFWPEADGLNTKLNLPGGEDPKCDERHGTPRAS